MMLDDENHKESVCLRRLVNLLYLLFNLEVSMETVRKAIVDEL